MGRVTLFEEHASVLPHWFARGLREATVICVDAHLRLRFIGPGRIARLRACASAAEMRALDGGHPLNPRREGCFGSEDFLYAAAQLGIVRRLVWVAPPHVQQDPGAALRALRQMEGVTAEQLASLQRVPGGWTEGRLLGLEIVICGWQQIGTVPLEAPVAVDMDAGFFVHPTSDRVWARPRVIVTALQERLGRAQELTLSRSVGSGVLPLHYRFLADHVAALWAAREEDARHWQRLLDLRTASLTPQERLAGLAALKVLRPDCAATFHALALQTEKTDERELLLARAARLDPHYAFDLLRRLGALRTRSEAPEPADLNRLYRELSDWDAAPGRQDAAWVALGLLYAVSGRRSEAISCDSQSRRHGARGHPELALQIGRLEMGANHCDRAVPWLERAAMDDATRVAAWLHLSVCASRRGAIGEAVNWARAAVEAAPAWNAPAQWLQGLAGKPGYDGGPPARSSVG